jgi:DNA polymerase-3 subunit delta'
MTSIWRGVVGQERAVTLLTEAITAPVHAYLFVGPPGSTKDEAARAFAAALVSADAHADTERSRDARLAMAGEHPDVREVLRQGATISKEQVVDIVRVAALAPVEGLRKVIILYECHLLDANGAARLLKTLEEPPASTVFVVLADQVPPDLVTVASRCVRVEFAALDEPTIVAVLHANGVDPSRAELAARSANGDLTRAQLLAADDGLVHRRHTFTSLPDRLDGTGATAVALTAELLTLIDDAAGPLAERHRTELSELETHVAASGERGSGRKQVEERHRRELRRHRADELRSGLAALAAAYRDQLVVNAGRRPQAWSDAVRRVHSAIEALDRNPNEPLLLQALLLDLPSR